MHQQQQQQQRYFYTFDGDDIDPNELFRQFFGANFGRQGGHAENHQRRPANRFSILLSQFLPIILMFLIYVLPYLLQSVSQLNLIFYNSN